MNIRTASSIACLTAGFVLALPAAADAASLRLRCEKRFDPARSKISVDGRNVSPNAIYTARVISGQNQATARPKSAVGDEVEFDFDSNPNDIAEGATAIVPTLIAARAGADVVGEILSPQGQVVASQSVECQFP